MPLQVGHIERYSAALRTLAAAVEASGEVGLRTLDAALRVEAAAVAGDGV